MHVLAGLDRPTSGEVWVDGTEITALDDGALTELRRDKLGFVFQFFNLIPVLDAEENITLPLRIAGRDADPSGSRRCSTRSGSPTVAPIDRPSSPAASSSGWRSPGR